MINPYKTSRRLFMIITKELQKELRDAAKQTGGTFGTLLFKHLKENKKTYVKTIEKQEQKVMAYGDRFRGIEHPLVADEVCKLTAVCDEVILMCEVLIDSIMDMETEYDARAFMTELLIFATNITDSIDVIDASSQSFKDKMKAQAFANAADQTREQTQELLNMKSALTPEQYDEYLKLYKERNTSIEKMADAQRCMAKAITGYANAKASTSLAMR